MTPQEREAEFPKRDAKLAQQVAESRKAAANRPQPQNPSSYPNSNQTSAPAPTPASAPNANRVIDGSQLSWVERLEAAAKLLGCDPKDIRISMSPMNPQPSQPQNPSPQDSELTKAQAEELSIDPALLKDYAIVGAYQIAKGAVKFGDWVVAMKNRLGEAFAFAPKDEQALFDAAKLKYEKVLQYEEEVFDKTEMAPPEEVGNEDQQVFFDAAKLKYEEVFGKMETPTPEDVVKSLGSAALTHKNVADVAKAHIWAGVRGENEVMAATHKTLQAVHPELTEREVRQKFSDYGKATFPSKDELS